MTAVVYVDAHIEAAKLFYSLSKQGREVQGHSSETLFLLALHVLMAALPVLPQVDFKLGNPMLPVEIDDYGFQDLESLDFSLGSGLQGLLGQIKDSLH